MQAGQVFSERRQLRDERRGDECSEQAYEGSDGHRQQRGSGPAWHAVSLRRCDERFERDGEQERERKKQKLGRQAKNDPHEKRGAEQLEDGDIRNADIESGRPLATNAPPLGRGLSHELAPARARRIAGREAGRDWAAKTTFSASPKRSETM